RAEGLDAMMLLQIHDELLFDVAERDLERTIALVRREMTGALELSVPLEVSVKVGPTWYDVEMVENSAPAEEAL
ncbi:hypothetical protein EPN42_12945, partial [bacterium]